jgi:hypothetical protein
MNLFRRFRLWFGTLLKVPVPFIDRLSDLGEPWLAGVPVDHANETSIVPKKHKPSTQAETPRAVPKMGMRFKRHLTSHKKLLVQVNGRTSVLRIIYPHRSAKTLNGLVTLRRCHHSGPGIQLPVDMLQQAGIPI